MRVYVYRNLKHGRSAKPLYSVMYRGKVIKHVRRILLDNVEFRVREGGRQRVLKEQRKNVHAFVIGNVVRSVMGIDKNRDRHLSPNVRYNPFEAGYFQVIPSGRPIRGAEAVLLNENGIHSYYGTFRLGDGANAGGRRRVSHDYGRLSP